MYTERGAIGHRYFQQQKIMPAYGFGYGLSYTPVVLSNSSGIVGWTRTKPENWWQVSNLCVQSLGDQTATETVQIYVQRKESLRLTKAA